MSEQPDIDIGWLARWYARQCDGEWEHGLGVSLGGLDNPGWYLRVAIEGTELEGMKTDFSRNVDESWITVRSDGLLFEAYCGLNDLAETLERCRTLFERRSV